MTDTILLKRRETGASGGPTGLRTGELAINMVDETIYAGIGNDSNGNATNIVAFAKGGIVANIPSGGLAGQALVKNTGNDGYTWTTINSGNNYTAGTGLTLSGFQFAIDSGIVALLESPDLTGNPTAPTQSGGDNSTKIATTAFVQARVQEILGGTPPSVLDTINEIAAAIQDNDTDIGAILTAQANKLNRSSNLSDLTDVVSARSNLGLGSMATQSSNNVTITGGTIDNITLDGGTF